MTPNTPLNPRTPSGERVLGADSPNVRGWGKDRLIEAMSIARSIAGQSGPRLDSNQEFVGQGLANIATAFLSGYTCSGSFTRSAVNYEAGHVALWRLPSLAGWFWWRC